MESSAAGELDVVNPPIVLLLRMILESHFLRNRMSSDAHRYAREAAGPPARFRFFHLFGSYLCPLGVVIPCCWI